MRLAAADPVERGVQRFLGAGLADRAGHADDLRFRALARRAAKVFQCLGRVRDQHVGTIHRLRHNCAGGARGKGPGDEFVAVVNRAWHGDEQVSGLHLATIESHAGDFERSTRAAAGRGFDFG